MGAAAATRPGVLHLSYSARSNRTLAFSTLTSLGFAILAASCGSRPPSNKATVTGPGQDATQDTLGGAGAGQRPGDELGLLLDGDSNGGAAPNTDRR